MWLFKNPNLPPPLSRLLLVQDPELEHVMESELVCAPEEERVSSSLDSLAVLNPLQLPGLYVWSTFRSSIFSPFSNFEPPGCDDFNACAIDDASTPDFDIEEEELEPWFFLCGSNDCVLRILRMLDARDRPVSGSCF